MVKDMSEVDLKQVGNIYAIHEKVKDAEFKAESKEKNTKLKLMVYMERINSKYDGYPNNKEDFVRSIKATSKVYSNKAAQLNDEANRTSSELKQSANLKAMDGFRNQIGHMKGIANNDVNWVLINGETGLLSDNTMLSVNDKFEHQWEKFASTYKHPSYAQASLDAEAALEEEAALNSTLNDPGDLDHDGNTMVPAGTAHALYMEDFNTPADLNNDGVLDNRDRDLADGRIDSVDRFSEEELIGLNDNLAPELLDELMDANDFDQSDFMEPEGDEFGMDF